MSAALGSLNGVTHTQAEHVVRLDMGDSSCWGLFPRYMERCVLFCQKLLDYNDMQLKNFEQDLRNRWATPNGGLFLAVMDGRGSMVGHLLGWVNVDYGRPYLFNFQVEMDEGYNLMPIVDQALVEHLDYIAWANAQYERAGQNIKIDKVVTQTMRNAGALIRYLKMKGVAAVAERTVVKWAV